MNFLLDSFSKDALEAHNKYRAMHQVPSLKWSRSLAKEAEAWAQTLAKESCLRNGDTDDGENLYGVTGKSDLKGHEVVDKWYDGVSNYNFRRPGFQSDAGHFTQIVWKSTKEVGVGKAKTPDGRVFVVARYRPPGNLGNRFEQNVFPKESGSSSSSSRVYTTRIEKQEAEPVRSERSSRLRDRFRDDDDEFFKDFKDMDIGRKGGKTETVTYNKGPGTTVVTKTFTTDDGTGVRTVRKEVHTSSHNGSDEDFGSRRRKWDDDDFFGKRDLNANVRSRWDDKRDKSPSSDRARSSSNRTGGSSPRSSSSSSKSFKDQCLTSHNNYRAMHSAPPLKWASDLARDAEKYAEKLARSGTLRHSSKSDREDTGENLAMFSGDYDNAGERASDMWYEEVKDYNFSRRGYQGGAGHFTQLVWKGSKELGMGRAKTPDGRCTYVVARYRPAGNVVNYMDENVAPKRR